MNLPVLVTWLPMPCTQLLKWPVVYRRHHHGIPLDMQLLTYCSYDSVYGVSLTHEHITPQEHSCMEKPGLLAPRVPTTGNRPGTDDS